MIEQEIIRVRDVRISIGALLDKALAAWVLAVTQSEEAKENAQIVSDGYMVIEVLLTSARSKRRTMQVGLLSMTMP